MLLLRRIYEGEEVYKETEEGPEDDPASGGDNPRKLQSIWLENQYPYCNQLPGQFNPYVPQFPMYQMPGFNQQMMMPMQPMAYGFQAPQFMSSASQQYYQQNNYSVGKNHENSP